MGSSETCLCVRGHFVGLNWLMALLEISRKRHNFIGSPGRQVGEDEGRGYTMDYEQIKKYLKGAFEKDFFDACIRNLADFGNPLRLSNFSYSLRELLREVLSDRAPDNKIRNCEWYVNDPIAKNEIIRADRVKYAIQGGLSDKLLNDKMLKLVTDTASSVQKQNSNLSKFTHITKDVFYNKQDVETLSNDALTIFLNTLKSIDDARYNFGLMFTEKIMDKLYLEKVLSDAYRKIDGIPANHNFNGFAIKEVLIQEISDSDIHFYTYGDIYISPLNDKLMAIPYNSTLVSKIPDTIDSLQLEICDFNVNVDEAERFE